MSEVYVRLQPIPRDWSGSPLRRSDRHDWNEISRLVRDAANCTCRSCGDEPRVHVHEQWEFDAEERLVQLDDLIVLCQLCHVAVHPTIPPCCGISLREAALHYCEAQGIDFEGYVERACECLYYERATRIKWWSLDLSLCDELLARGE